MKSPDGQCWRGTMDNLGSLNFMPITCPEDVLVSVEEEKTTMKISIFPNPTEENVKIKIEEFGLKKLKYSIFDVNGKELHQGKIKNNEQLVELSSLKSGIYLIKIIDRKGRIIDTKKVIKK